MDINTVKSAIIMNSFNNDELNILAEAIRYARAQLGHQVKQELRVGSKVEFTDTKRNHTYQGTVSKVNIKYVIVDTAKGRFRVPASMLTTV